MLFPFPVASNSGIVPMPRLWEFKLIQLYDDGPQGISQVPELRLLYAVGCFRMFLVILLSSSTYVLA